MPVKPGINKDNFKSDVRIQDDLYRHVNGKWLDGFEIPADKAIYGSFYRLRDDSESAVKEILEEAIENPSPGVQQQIGDLYASFLNEELANKKGIDPIKEELASIEKLQSIQEAIKLTGELSKVGVGGFLGMYVDNDPGDPERYLPMLAQGGIGLPDEAYYREEKHEQTRADYLNHLRNMFDLAGSDDPLGDANKVLELETAIASHHWSVVETREAEKTYNLKTFSELKALSSFDFDAWLQGMGKNETLLAEVSVMMPSFFENIGKVLEEAGLETVKLWIKSSLLRSSAAYLSDEFVNEKFDFYGRTLTGAEEIKERWKRGVSLVEAGMGEAVGQLYVERHFKPEAKAQMDKLVQYLIEAYRQSIEQLDWMTDETKQRALEKLSKFNPKIGYPEKWKDYSSIVINKDDLVENVRQLNIWEFEFEAKKIGATVDRDEWHMSPQTVNAYFNPGFNEIVFPAAILQPPFFSADVDAAINFGGIGAVIGHEIGHGFDDQGSKYDGDGRLVSWWTEEDRKAFEERTKKLIDQYNELSPKQLEDELKVNGEFTIGENIGDLGGLGIAWKAYLLSLEGAEPAVIDGQSAAERFFYSWAQCWQSKARDEIAKQLLSIDPHSPAEFRCNQVVRNLDLFHETFNTSVDDELYLEPDQRVSIW
ncbi:MAG: M13-type metalloendopeptidase [Microbacteriaceae bacterium]|nr:M13-type metalloendopeptidase [Microbacteriaceae bacterium]